MKENSPIANDHTLDGLHSPCVFFFFFFFFFFALKSPRSLPSYVMYIHMYYCIEECTDWKKRTREINENIKKCFLFF